jgi:hypothetical protein
MMSYHNDALKEPKRHQRNAVREMRAWAKVILLALTAIAGAVLGSALYGDPGADRYVTCEQLLHNERCTMARPNALFRE